jgi:aryl-alcohol dehydrogenase-like predicted oxidoreductase
VRRARSATIRAAVDQGVDLIDTAGFGMGTTNP